MASQDTVRHMQLPEGNSFPNPYSDSGDAASIQSSRMTDVASDDGRDPAVETPAQQGGRRPSTHAIDPARPNTSGTSASSQPGTWSHTPPSRRGYASPQRSISGSITGAGRLQNSTSRTHVPSLASNAFFRPMSSQRLQAHRGSRPSNAFPQIASGKKSAESSSSFPGQQTFTMNESPQREQGVQHGGEMLSPPSRGTEATEMDTAGRVTANTTPTQGYHQTESQSESETPLQRNNANHKGLSLKIDKNYKNGGLPTPSRSSMSFRNSYLLPTRGDSENRSTQGAEKLPSNASSPRLPPSKASEDLEKSEQAKLGSNHQYFTGNTVFCWGGRLQNTRHRPINIATGTFVATPAVLFFVFSAPWLWQNISPAIPIVFAYLFYICISSFIHASVSDPGILPRNIHQAHSTEENEDPLPLAPPLNDWTMIKSATSATAAMEVPTKYCKTCNIWRPPRGHHCRVCDNCIETQDHHCVWLNNCVGRRNYRYFFTFVSSGALLGLFLLGASLTQVLVYMVRQHISFGHAISHFRVPFAMAIYGLLVTPYPAALTTYHLFLMGRGETTREYLNSHKFLKKDRHRPFTQGSAIKNWFVVLCRPRPPTYLNFKRKYEAGDQRFGERRGKRTAPLQKEVEAGGVSMEMQTVDKGDSGFQGPVTLRAAEAGTSA